uniref:Deoxyhypusine hydroxylase n=1 Tax=Cacopsylla melanoneura TaxID=428564 RepID=A0A8D8UQJ0_9HEMI
MIPDEKTVLIGKVLKDSTKPLKERFRALFTLKNIGGKTAINCISEAFTDESALLKHELAYCLGQMKDVDANKILSKVLEDKDHEPMVRHEAAEALGAIGDPNSISILEKYAQDPVKEVSETCYLALKRIKSMTAPETDKKDNTNNIYGSVDPAPPLEDVNDINKLKNILLDENEDLYMRYKAMFNFDINSVESTLALTEGLSCGSSLYRHEIAFVLGQMQNPSSIPALTSALEDQSQNEMVRHECAEALGAIATPECYQV